MTRLQSVFSRSRHMPKSIFARNPITKPICIRRLKEAEIITIWTGSFWHVFRSTHEKITLLVISLSLPSSQNTAGLGFFMKKKGKIGKKNPIIVPWSIAEFVDAEWERITLPELSIESIHCSSSARKCSSSIRPPVLVLVQIKRRIKDSHILLLFQNPCPDN